MWLSSLYSPPPLVALLPGLPDFRGVHSEVAPLLVRHHHQDGAPGRVELLAVLHLLVGRAGRVQLAGAEIFLLKWRQQQPLSQLNSLHSAAAADHLVHGGFAVQIHRAVVLGSLHLAGVIIGGYSQHPL